MATDQARQAAANKEAQAAAKKTADETAKVKAQSVEEAEKKMSGSKPTPTQAENDLAKLGVPLPEKEDDGSGPDPANQPVATARGGGIQRQLQPGESASYQTRSTTSTERKEEKKP